MIIRKAIRQDVPYMLTLIKQAQDYFKRNGIDQWQDGYPNEEQLLGDIHKEHSYVLCDNNIIGTMYFAIENDINYAKIDGQWKTNQQPYAVIHRIVVDENVKGKGLAKKLLLYAQKECQQHHIHSIRIDTHEDNLSMQAFLKKNGFEFCGHIQLESGAPRIAFEKIIE